MSTNIIKRMMWLLIVLLSTSISGFSANELIGLVDKTTGRGIPDARTVFMSIDAPVISEELDPVWNLEKGNYATGMPLYVFTETDPVWTAVAGTVVYSAQMGTGATWDGSQWNFAGAEIDPVWMHDKTNGIITFGNSDNGYLYIDPFGGKIYKCGDNNAIQFGCDDTGLLIGPWDADSTRVEEGPNRITTYSWVTDYVANHSIDTETDPVWLSEKGSYLTAETDPIWSADKLSGFSTGGSILPTSSNLYSLGSADYPWRDVYIGSNTLYLGDGQFRSVSGELYRAVFSLSNIIGRINLFTLADTDKIQFGGMFGGNFMDEIGFVTGTNSIYWTGSSTAPDEVQRIGLAIPYRGSSQGEPSWPATQFFCHVESYVPTTLLFVDDAGGTWSPVIDENGITVLECTDTNRAEYYPEIWISPSGTDTGTITRFDIYYYSEVASIVTNWIVVGELAEETDPVWESEKGSYLTAETDPVWDADKLSGFSTGGSILPALSNYHNLGSSDFPWSNIYAHTFNAIGSSYQIDGRNVLMVDEASGNPTIPNLLIIENTDPIPDYSYDFSTDPTLDYFSFVSTPQATGSWNSVGHYIEAHRIALDGSPQSIITWDIPDDVISTGRWFSFNLLCATGKLYVSGAGPNAGPFTNVGVYTLTWTGNLYTISFAPLGISDSVSWFDIDDFKVGIIGNNSTATNPALTSESDPVWNSEKSNYATGTPVYAFTETDPAWYEGDDIKSAGDVNAIETDPVWEGDKLSGFSTPSILVGDAGTSRGTFHIKSSTDQLVIEDTDGPLDEKYWVVKSDNGIMELITGNDSWNNWSGVLKIYRDGVSVTGLYVNTSIIPEQSNVYDLGSSDNPFATIYAHTFNAVGSSYQIDGQDVLSLNSEGQPIINDLYVSSGGETGVPLLVESDPGWTSASNLYYLKTQTDSKYITGGMLSVSNPGSYTSEEYDFVNQHYTNDTGWKITSGQLRWYTNIGWRATYPTYQGTLALTNPLGLGVFRVTSIGTRISVGSSWVINPGSMTWALNVDNAIETNIYTFTNNIATNCLSYTGWTAYGNPTIMTTLVERIYSISQLQSTNELDPLWTADKPRYATGTPVYVETDPIWTVDKFYYTDRLIDSYTNDFNQNPSNDFSFVQTCWSGACGSPDGRPYWDSSDLRVKGIGGTFGHEPFPPYNAWLYNVSFTNIQLVDDISPMALNRFSFVVTNVSITGAGGYGVPGKLWCKIYDNSVIVTQQLSSGFNSILYTGTWNKIEFTCYIQDSAVHYINYEIDNFKIEKERILTYGNILSANSNMYNIGSQDNPFATIHAHTFNAVGSSYQIDGQDVLSLNSEGNPTISNLVIVSEGGETGTPIIVEADPVWNIEKSNYATGTPLYVFTESDPVWNNDKSNGFSVNGSILPQTSNEYDLGSANMPWRDIYVSTGSIHIGNSILSEKDGSVAVNDIPLVYQQVSYSTNISIITSNRFITGIDPNYYVVNGSYVKWIDYGAPDFYLNMNGCEPAGLSTIVVSFVSDEITNSIFYIPWGDMGGGAFSKNITCEWSRINFHIDRESECPAENTIFYYDDGTNHEFGKYTFKYNYLATVNGSDDWYFRYMMIEKDIIATSNSSPLFSESDPLWIADKSAGKTVFHEIVDINNVTTRFEYAAGLLTSLKTNGTEVINP